MAAIKNDRVFKQNMESVVDFLLFGCLPSKRWDLNAGARRKFIERFLEIEVLALHHKLEDITTLIALTEATPGAGIRPDHERGRVLVFVEGAKACIVPAGMAQLDACLRGKIHDIYFGFNLINDRHP